GGYSSVDTLRHGHGYWVKVDQAGSLSISSSAAIPLAGAGTLSSFASLTVKDAQGNVQKLFVGTAGSTIDTRRFAIPPAAPDESFGVHFHSNSFAELLGSDGIGEFLIDITAASFPVTLTCSSPHPMDARIKAGDFSRNLEGGEAVIIAAPQSSISLEFGSKAVPTAFALKQNYPNPFNPSTSLQYDIPSPSRVSLRVYDLLGRVVATLVNGEARGAGTFRAEFRGAD